LNPSARRPGMLVRPGLAQCQFLAESLRSCRHQITMNPNNLRRRIHQVLK
jgi:hypothetical protein